MGVKSRKDVNRLEVPILVCLNRDKKTGNQRTSCGIYNISYILLLFIGSFVKSQWQLSEDKGSLKTLGSFRSLKQFGIY